MRTLTLLLILSLMACGTEREVNTIQARQSALSTTDGGSDGGVTDGGTDPCATPKRPEAAPKGWGKRCSKSADCGGVPMYCNIPSGCSTGWCDEGGI